MHNQEIDINPPAGMKTVLCNNRPIGYVKDVADPTEAAKLAKDLLVSKGLWRDKPKTEMIFDQAVSFANAAKHIYDKDLKSLPRNPQGITPFVVNAAFSAEMYLKCLLYASGKISGSHVLTVIFKVLPNKVKDKINKKCKLLESQYAIEKGVLFKEHLKNINNAFVEWRYIYEKSTDSVQIQQAIFVLHVLHDVSVVEIGVRT